MLFLSLNCFDSCSKLHHQYFLKEIKSMMHIKLYFLRLLFFLISYHFSQKPWSKFELAQKANSCVTFQSRRSSEFGRIPFLHGGWNQETTGKKMSIIYIVYIYSENIVISHFLWVDSKCVVILRFNVHWQQTEKRWHRIMCQKTWKIF